VPEGSRAGPTYSQERLDHREDGAEDHRAVDEVDLPDGLGEVLGSDPKHVLGKNSQRVRLKEMEGEEGREEEEEGEEEEEEEGHTWMTLRLDEEDTMLSFTWLRSTTSVCLYLQARGRL